MIAMAPKAKPKAKAKAAVKARAKAAIHRAARRGALRRPAGAPAAVVAPGVIDRWRAGEEVALSEITLEELGRGVKIALTKGSYFLAEGQVAGTLDSMTVEAGEVHLALTPTGTTNENLLKHCTGNPGKLIRCHRCTPLCAGERVADDLIHGSHARLLRSREEEEEGWAYNLVAVGPGEDDLRDVRARAETRGVAEAAKKDREVEGREVRSRSRRRRSAARGRSSKKKKKKARGKSRRKARRESGGSTARAARRKPKAVAPPGHTRLHPAVRVQPKWMGVTPAVLQRSR